MGTDALRRDFSEVSVSALSSPKMPCDKRMREPWSACSVTRVLVATTSVVIASPFTVAATSAYEVRRNESGMEKLHVGFTVWYVFSLQDKIRFTLSNFSFIPTFS